MLSIPEAEVNTLLRDIKASLKEHPTVKAVPVPGAADHRKMLSSGKRYAIMKQTVFKGSEVIYVTDVLSQEDLEYYN